jgi:hypothetical protein
MKFLFKKLFTEKDFLDHYEQIKEASNASEADHFAEAYYLWVRDGQEEMNDPDRNRNPLAPSNRTHALEELDLHGYGMLKGPRSKRLEHVIKGKVFLPTDDPDLNERIERRDTKHRAQDSFSYRIAYPQETLDNPKRYNSGFGNKTSERRLNVIRSLYGKKTIGPNETLPSDIRAEAKRMKRIARINEQTSNLTEDQDKPIIEEEERNLTPRDINKAGKVLGSAESTLEPQKKKKEPQKVPGFKTAEEYAAEEEERRKWMEEDVEAHPELYKHRGPDAPPMNEEELKEWNRKWDETHGINKKSEGSKDAADDEGDISQGGPWVGSIKKGLEVRPDEEDDTWGGTFRKTKQSIMSIRPNLFGHNEPEDLKFGERRGDYGGGDWKSSFNQVPIKAGARNPSPGGKHTERIETTYAGKKDKGKLKPHKIRLAVPNEEQSFEAWRDHNIEVLQTDLGIPPHQAKQLVDDNAELAWGEDLPVAKKYSEATLKEIREGRHITQEHLKDPEVKAQLRKAMSEQAARERQYELSHREKDIVKDEETGKETEVPRTVKNRLPGIVATQGVAVDKPDKRSLWGKFVDWTDKPFSFGFGGSKGRVSNQNFDVDLGTRILNQNLTHSSAGHTFPGHPDQEVKFHLGVPGESTTYNRWKAIQMRDIAEAGVEDIDAIARFVDDHAHEVWNADELDAAVRNPEKYRHELELYTTKTNDEQRDILNSRAPIDEKAERLKRINARRAKEQQDKLDKEEATRKGLQEQENRKREAREKYNAEQLSSLKSQEEHLQKTKEQMDLAHNEQIENLKIIASRGTSSHEKKFANIRLDEAVRNHAKDSEEIDNSLSDVRRRIQEEQDRQEAERPKPEPERLNEELQEGQHRKRSYAPRQLVPKKEKQGLFDKDYQEAEPKEGSSTETPYVPPWFTKEQREAALSDTGGFTSQFGKSKTPISRPEGQSGFSSYAPKEPDKEQKSNFLSQHGRGSSDDGSEEEDLGNIGEPPESSSYVKKNQQALVPEESRIRGGGKTKAEKLIEDGLQTKEGQEQPELFKPPKKPRHEQIRSTQYLNELGNKIQDYPADKDEFEEKIDKRRKWFSELGQDEQDEFEDIVANEQSRRNRLNLWRKDPVNVEPFDAPELFKTEEERRQEQQDRDNPLLQAKREQLEEDPEAQYEREPVDENEKEEEPPKEPEIGNFYEQPPKFKDYLQADEFKNKPEEARRVFDEHLAEWKERALSTHRKRNSAQGRELSPEERKQADTEFDYILKQSGEPGKKEGRLPDNPPLFDPKDLTYQGDDKPKPKQNIEEPDFGYEPGKDRPDLNLQYPKTEERDAYEKQKAEERRKEHFANKYKEDQDAWEAFKKKSDNHEETDLTQWNENYQASPFTEDTKDPDLFVHPSLLVSGEHPKEEEKDIEEYKVPTQFDESGNEIPPTKFQELKGKGTNLVRKGTSLFNKGTGALSKVEDIASQPIRQTVKDMGQKAEEFLDKTTIGQKGKVLFGKGKEKVKKGKELVEKFDDAITNRREIVETQVDKAKAYITRKLDESPFYQKLKSKYEQAEETFNLAKAELELVADTVDAIAPGTMKALDKATGGHYSAAKAKYDNARKVVEEKRAEIKKYVDEVDEKVGKIQQTVHSKVDEGVNLVKTKVQAIEDIVDKQRQEIVGRAKKGIDEGVRIQNILRDRDLLPKGYKPYVPIEEREKERAKGIGMGGGEHEPEEQQYDPLGIINTPQGGYGQYDQGPSTPQRPDDAERWRNEQLDELHRQRAAEAKAGGGIIPDKRRSEFKNQEDDIEIEYIKRQTKQDADWEESQKPPGPEPEPTKITEDTKDHPIFHYDKPLHPIHRRRIESPRDFKNRMLEKLDAKIRKHPSLNYKFNSKGRAEIEKERQSIEERYNYMVKVQAAEDLGMTKKLDGPINVKTGKTPFEEWQVPGDYIPIEDRQENLKEGQEAPKPEVKEPEAPKRLEDPREAPYRERMARIREEEERLQQRIEEATQGGTLPLSRGEQVQVDQFKADIEEERAAAEAEHDQSADEWYEQSLSRWSKSVPQRMKAITPNTPRKEVDRQREIINNERIEIENEAERRRAFQSQKEEDERRAAEPPQEQEPEAPQEAPAPDRQIPLFEPPVNIAAKRRPPVPRRTQPPTPTGKTKEETLASRLEQRQYENDYAQYQKDLAANEAAPSGIDKVRRRQDLEERKKNLDARHAQMQANGALFNVHDEAVQDIPFQQKFSPAGGFTMEATGTTAKQIKDRNEILNDEREERFGLKQDPLKANIPPTNFTVSPTTGKDIYREGGLQQLSVEDLKKEQSADIMLRNIMKEAEPLRQAFANRKDENVYVKLPDGSDYKLTPEEVEKGEKHLRDIDNAAAGRGWATTGEGITSNHPEIWREATGPDYSNPEGITPYNLGPQGNILENETEQVPLKMQAPELIEKGKFPQRSPEEQRLRLKARGQARAGFVNPVLTPDEKYELDRFTDLQNRNQELSPKELGRQAFLQDKAAKGEPEFDPREYRALKNAQMRQYDYETPEGNKLSRPNFALTEEQENRLALYERMNQERVAQGELDESPKELPDWAEELQYLNSQSSRKLTPEQIKRRDFLLLKDKNRIDKGKKPVIAPKEGVWKKLTDKFRAGKVSDSSWENDGAGEELTDLEGTPAPTLKISWTPDEMKLPIEQRPPLATPEEIQRATTASGLPLATVQNKEHKSPLVINTLSEKRDQQGRRIPTGKTDTFAGKVEIPPLKNKRVRDELLFQESPIKGRDISDKVPPPPEPPPLFASKEELEAYKVRIQAREDAAKRKAKYLKRHPETAQGMDELEYNSRATALQKQKMEDPYDPARGGNILTGVLAAPLIGPKFAKGSLAAESKEARTYGTPGKQDYVNGKPVYDAGNRGRMLTSEDYDNSGMPLKESLEKFPDDVHVIRGTEKGADKFNRADPHSYLRNGKKPSNRLETIYTGETKTSPHLLEEFVPFGKEANFEKRHKGATVSNIDEEAASQGYEIPDYYDEKDRQGTWMRATYPDNREFVPGKKQIEHSGNLIQSSIRRLINSSRDKVDDKTGELIGGNTFGLSPRLKKDKTYEGHIRYEDATRPVEQRTIEHTPLRGQSDYDNLFKAPTGIMSPEKRHALLLRETSTVPFADRDPDRRAVFNPTVPDEYSGFKDYIDPKEKALPKTSKIAPFNPDPWKRYNTGGF